jgi:hypothetical protein
MNKCAGLKKTVDEPIGEDTCECLLLIDISGTNEISGLTELPGGHMDE